MKVLKFGGTSVGTIDSLIKVREIVNAIKGDVIVVVSALGGLTDKLIASAYESSEGKCNIEKFIEETSKRHFDIIDALVPESRRKDTQDRVSDLLAHLQRVYTGVSLIGHLPLQTLNLIVSFGERMSSTIIAAILNDAVLYDSLDFIMSEKFYDKNIADQKLTDKLTKEKFSGKIGKVVCPGFISRDKDTQEITNLGRGGSDFTAALIAAALDAELLEIWTDVDGFMTADPRKVKDAKVIDNMTFIESMELCTFGAKVVYPPTIYPVFHKNIPIKILNTFNSIAPGTLITDRNQDGTIPIKGVTSLSNTALISISCHQDKPSLKDLDRRCYSTIAKEGIKIYPVYNSDAYRSFSFAINQDDLIKATKLIYKEFAPEIARELIHEPKIMDSLSTLAIVGCKMKGQEPLIEKILSVLKEENIGVKAISPNYSDTTFTLMVESNVADKALNTVHSIIFD